MNNLETSLVFWGLQQILAQRAFEEAHRLPPITSPLGVKRTSISDGLLRLFDEAWETTPHKKHDPEACDRRYAVASDDHPSEFWDTYIPHLEFTETMQTLVASLCDELRDFTQMALGYYVSFINARVYECVPGADDSYFAVHSDCYPQSIKKIMVFITPPGASYGTMALEGEDGTILLEGNAGTAFLFDNNLPHRAVPPTENVRRRAIELTVAPSVYPDSTLHVAGTAANWPRLPLDILDYLDQLESKGLKVGVHSGQPGDAENALKNFYLQRKRDAEIVPDKLNIGGGPHFYHPGWINLDGAFGVANLYPFKFHERCHFPIENEAINQIYSCHTFEHFDERTLSRVLSEAHRVLSSDGEFLIKIPDFDLYFELYDRGDIQALERLTLIHKVSKYIVEEGIDITNETVLSFSMCNYWNSAYGADLYQKSTITDSKGAYFGPAKIRDPEMLREFFKSRSPYKISQALRSFVVTTEGDYTWGHQIAFSFLEFKDFVENHGFTVLNNDKQKVLEHCSHWPEIEWLADRSMFVLLRKH